MLVTVASGKDPVEPHPRTAGRAPTRRRRHRRPGRGIRRLSRLPVLAHPRGGARVPTASPRPTPTGVAAELLPFYEQTLDWERLRRRFECTTVTAPLDWADPSAGEIELSVDPAARRRAAKRSGRC